MLRDRLSGCRLHRRPLSNRHWIVLVPLPAFWQTAQQSDCPAHWSVQRFELRETQDLRNWVAAEYSLGDRGVAHRTDQLFELRREEIGPTSRCSGWPAESLWTDNSRLGSTTRPCV